jgi:methylase of polypeptide subunit release factors
MNNELRGSGIHHRHSEILAPPAWVRFRPSTRPHKGIEPHHPVLDVGCGCGVATLSAAQVARTAFGVDISKPLLVAQWRNRLGFPLLEG